MAQLQVTLDQVVELINQLSIDDQQRVLSLMHRSADSSSLSMKCDPETQEWLDADLAGELPEYDWGESGVPLGKPVRYISGQGLVVEGGRDLG